MPKAQGGLSPYPPMRTFPNERERVKYAPYRDREIASCLSNDGRSCLALIIRKSISQLVKSQRPEAQQDFASLNVNLNLIIRLTKFPLSKSH